MSFLCLVSSLSFPQSPGTRRRAPCFDVAPQDSSLACPANACPPGCALASLLQQFALNPRGRLGALKFPSHTSEYACFGESFDDAACRVTRSGIQFPSKDGVAGHSTKSRDGIHFFQTKKIRKLIASGGVPILSSTQLLSVGLDDTEEPEGGIVSHGQTLGRKRRWLSGSLKWEDVAASNQEFSKFNPECTGGNDSGDSSGSGGYWGGGGDQGGDKLEPGDFGDHNVPLMDLNASQEAMEEEQEESDDRRVVSKDRESETMQLLASIGGVGNEMTENRKEKLTSCSEASQENFVESDCKSAAVNSSGISEHVSRAVTAFYSDMRRFFFSRESKESEARLASFTLGPAQVNYSGGNTPWSHNDGDMQLVVQAPERTLGVDGLTEPSGEEGLEKVRGVTSGPIQPSPVVEESQQSKKQGSATEAMETGLVLDLQFRAAGTGLERVSISEAQRKSVSVSNLERGLATGEVTAAHLQPEAELSTEATRILGHQRSVIKWAAGSLIGTQTGGLGKLEQVEKETLKNLVNETAIDEVGLVVAKCSETETLRRLQQETFSDLLKLRERLGKIEQLTCIWQSTGIGNPLGVARTHLKGEVNVGTAFVTLEDSNSRHSRASLEQAGMRTGLDVRFTFETPFREKDLLVTQCVAGQGSSVGDGRALGGPFTLRKVSYLAQMNDDVSISFVPLGAQGKDVTEIINPLQDQGLTTFSTNGPVLLNHCKGSAVGISVSGSSFGFSLAQYLSGWGNHIATMEPTSAESDPLCLSTLGQFLLQPSRSIIFSLCGLNRYWPSPPLPSSVGLHWSEMGPLVIPKIQSMHKNRSTITPRASNSTSVLHANSVGSHWSPHDLEYGNGALEMKGTAVQSFAIAGEMLLGEDVSVGCWAQVERADWLQDSDKGNFQWALNLANNSGGGIDWGASIGGSRPDFWSTETNDQQFYTDYLGGVGELFGPQLHLEAFFKINFGRGFTLQPGLLYVLSKNSHTPALMVRSSWSL